MVAREQHVAAVRASVGEATAFRRKVLYLVDTLTGEGGTESALAKMASLLPSRGWDCTIGTFRLAVDNPAFLRLFNCPIVDFTMHNTYGWTAWKTAWRLRRFVAREVGFKWRGGKLPCWKPELPARAIKVIDVLCAYFRASEQPGSAFGGGKGIQNVAQ